MSISSTLRSALRRRRETTRLYDLYRRFQDYTMIPADLYVDNLRLAQRVIQLPGCVVECGVWRGGMSAGLAKMLGPDRKYFLFDSFEGLPPADEIDGVAALKWQGNKEAPGYHDNCTASETFAHRAMGRASAKSYQLVKGWFNTTVPGFKTSEPIALLRLDADWYESTSICLESLFDQVAPGGLVVIDDYHTWDGCSRAVHDFLSRRSAVERIREFNGIGFLQKQAAA